MFHSESQKNRAVQMYQTEGLFCVKCHLSPFVTCKLRDEILNSVSSIAGLDFVLSISEHCKACNDRKKR